MNPEDDNIATAGSYSPVLSVDHINATQTGYKVTPASAKQKLALRPQVLQAMRALHEMPPFAREREIETGRYSHFSTKEKELLKAVN